MQAILTKYLSATNRHESRIKATAWRGSITMPYPHRRDSDQAHVDAAQALVDKFNAEDVAKNPADTKGMWTRPFVSGCLPDQTWAHVFMPARAEATEGNL